LEGLEVVETNLLSTTENKDFRIDSDYYTKAPKKNPTLEYDKIGNLLKYAQYGISIAMNEERIGYPIYRMNEIHNMLCDVDVDKYADISNEELEKFELNDRDVLFNRTNSFEWVGRTGIYYKKSKEKYTFASYLVRFIPHESKLLPEYLATFLSTKYGVWDIKRRARQSINQTNVNPEEVKEIDIPILAMSIQNILKKCFEKANKLRITSQDLYSQAEILLLQSIGLQDFKPSTEALNFKSFKESFGASGRLDAEYYQKKYEDYISIVQKHPNGWQTLNNACTVKDTNFNPDAKTIYKYIELSDIGKTGDITGCTTAFGNDLPSRARRVVKTGDVVISSIEGSLSSCAMVQEEYNNALCSTGFYVINSNKMNSATLLVLFKSEVMQNILKQGCSGTILTAINKNEFLNIPLPLITDDVQETISSSLQESFSLKKQSEHLLEVAKKAVEMAIEEGEKRAMEWMEEARRASILINK